MISIKLEATFKKNNENFQIAIQNIFANVLTSINFNIATNKFSFFFEIS